MIDVHALLGFPIHYQPPIEVVLFFYHPCILEQTTHLFLREKVDLGSLSTHVKILRDQPVEIGKMLVSYQVS
jgi:hypothetical protein